MKNIKIFIAMLLAIVSIIIFTLVYPNSEPDHISAESEYFNFEESVLKADIIATVKVKKVVEEWVDPEKTIYSAVILDLYKGNLDLKEIYIMQEGNSDWIYNNNEQFKNNEKITLMLMKSTNLDNTYWVLSEDINYYKHIELDGVSSVIKWSRSDSTFEKYDKKEEKDKFSERYNKNGKGNYKVKDLQVIDENDFKKILKETIKNLDL